MKLFDVLELQQSINQLNQENQELKQENKKLKSKFDKVDFLNKKQLKSINVDLDKRLKEYLKWIIS